MVHRDVLIRMGITPSDICLLSFVAHTPSVQAEASSPCKYSKIIYLFLQTLFIGLQKMKVAFYF